MVVVTLVEEIKILVIEVKVSVNVITKATEAIIIIGGCIVKNVGIFIASWSKQI